MNDSIQLPISRVAASAAILQDGKILLVKRVDDASTCPGMWTFPAGGVDATDQSVQEAVVREVKEETNLDFTPTRKWNFYESVADGKRAVSLVFLGDWTGTIKLQKEELSDWRFFTYEETREFELAFAYREVVDDLHDAGLLGVA